MAPGQGGGDAPRSHLVFCITMESTNTVTGKVTAGKLSLVDLAGSERLKKTRIDATGVEVVPPSSRLLKPPLSSALSVF